MSGPAWRRVAIAAVWIGAIVLWQIHLTTSGRGTVETAQRVVDALEGAWWGPLLFTLLYLVRPLLLVPASLMTVAAGLIFGPVGGVLLVVLAANASAMLAYGVGRSIAGTPDADAERARLVDRWGARLRARSFETVFVMRLLFMPYDLVNYASGALRIRWSSFLVATVLGTLPGTVSFVLLGASLERLDEGLGGVDPWTVVAGVAIFALSLLVARLARARHAAAPDLPPTAPSTPPPSPPEDSTWPTSTPLAPIEQRSSDRARAD